MLHELPDLSRLLDSAPARSNYGSAIRSRSFGYATRYGNRCSLAGRAGSGRARQARADASCSLMERAMKLVSSAFDDGAAIPRRFTCDGENLSPPLQWSGAPAGTLSFVLLCDDPDAPAGTWHHWAAYDIPPAVTELAVDAEQNAKLRQAVNDFRKVGYGGPCPPHGHGPHHYHFRLLALSTDQLRAKANASCRDIERKARKYAIAEAILVGRYER